MQIKTTEVPHHTSQNGHHQNQFSSVQFSSVKELCLTLWLHGLKHTRFPYSSPIPRAYSNSCPSSEWCHPTISSSAVPFSSHLQSFPASGTFLVSRLFASDDQNTGASASASVLPVNIQGWYPLRLTGSPCCPRDFQESSPAPQFEVINSPVFCLLYGPALTSIHDHWEDHSLDYTELCLQSNISAFQYTV